MKAGGVVRVHAIWVPESSITSRMQLEECELEERTWEIDTGPEVLLDAHELDVWVCKKCRAVYETEKPEGPR